VAVVLPASTYWGAFYSGISAPILISNIAGIPRRITGDVVWREIPREIGRPSPAGPSAPEPSTRPVVVKKGGSLKIWIEAVGGPVSKLFLVEVRPEHTIGEIKEVICNAVMSPPHRVVLMWGGLMLDGDRSVADVGLSENSRLALMPTNIMGGCIAQGTEVLMASGKAKKVEELQVGDKVLSWHLEGHRLVEGTVIRLITDRSNELIRLNDRLVVSRQQLVYTKSDWKSAYQLDGEDEIAELHHSGSLTFTKVKSVHGLDAPCSTYDMKIVPLQTYFGNRTLLYDTKPILTTSPLQKPARRRRVTLREWLGLMTLSRNSHNP